MRGSLYYVYNNLNAHLNGENKCISVNRQEPGLHFGVGLNNEHLLLDHWEDSYIKFPNKVAKFEFNGTMHRDL